MQLLKKIPYNFRYYLFTSTKNEIVIVYIHTDFDIDDDTQTMLETNYIPIFKNKFSFIDSQTIKITCKDDEMQLKDFNKRIRDYCKARHDSTKVSLYSATPTYKLMFEAETMKAVFDCCKNLYVELGSEGCFKTGKDDFHQMDTIEIKSGQWFLDEETTIYTKEFIAKDLKIDEYSRGKHSSIFNLVISESFKGMRIQMYSTIQLNVLNSSRDPDKFEEGKINFAYIYIFGEEVLDDINVARMEFHGFNNVGLGCVEVAEEVKYGNIVYVDNVTKFKILKVKRSIRQIKEGSFLQIKRVGSTTLYDIQYNLTDESTMLDGTAIVQFLNTEGDQLEKTLNIFNSTITNITGRKLIICKVVNTEIKKLYISKCLLSNDVSMVESDENSKITQFNYNDCTFNSSGDFEINNVIKLSLSNVNFNVVGQVKLSSPNISVSGGKWKIGKLLIDNEKEIISKVVLNNIILTADEIDIRNSLLEGDEDLIFYDSDCIIRAKKYHISGYKPTFTKTFFMCNEINFECLTVTTLANVKIGFDKGNTIMNVFSSLAGSLELTTDGLENKVFAINLNDKNLFMNVNTVDFNFIDKPSPAMYFKTNTPIKFILNNYLKDNVSFEYTEKPASEQSSKIIYKPSVTEPEKEFKVFNDSEKLCEITKKKDEEDSSADLFEITVK